MTVGSRPARGRRLFPSYPGVPSSIVDGPDEVRRKVRELVRAGAEVIKIATSGGVLSPRDKPQQPGFDVEEIEAISPRRAAAGLWVMSHAQSTVGIKSAVRAGVRSIEHGIYLDDEAIQLMLDHGAYLVPTLVAPLGVIRAAEAGARIPEVAVTKAREVIEAHQDSFRRAVEAGVKVAMGTDAGSGPARHESRGAPADGRRGHEPGGRARRDDAHRRRADGAEPATLGTIEPGKRADLVVVSGDPFDFRDLAGRIERVYQDGVLVAGAAPEPVAAAV